MNFAITKGDQRKQTTGSSWELGFEHESRALEDGCDHIARL